MHFWCVCRGRWASHPPLPSWSPSLYRFQFPNCCVVAYEISFVERYYVPWAVRVLVLAGHSSWLAVLQSKLQMFTVGLGAIFSKSKIVHMWRTLPGDLVPWLYQSRNCSLDRSPPTSEESSLHRVIKLRTLDYVVQNLPYIGGNQISEPRVFIPFFRGVSVCLLEIRSPLSQTSDSCMSTPGAFHQEGRGW